MRKSYQKELNFTVARILVWVITGFFCAFFPVFMFSTMSFSVSLKVLFLEMFVAIVAVCFFLTMWDSLTYIDYLRGKTFGKTSMLRNKRA
ncbi:hypothetical protein CMI37_29830 [Candidatus Pacearchaeota archaeon]|nr:hypothetical protein [Candidatus Pacearchaeota archaeon]